MDDGLLTRRELLERALKTTAGAFAATALPRSSWSEEQKRPIGIGKIYMIGGSIGPDRKNQLLPSDTEQALAHCDPHGIMQRLCKDSDATHRRIVIITCAAGNEIKEGDSLQETMKQKYTREYREEFGAAGATKIVTISNPGEVLSKSAAEAIADPATSMVFLGGGNQENLVAEFRYGLSPEAYGEVLAKGEVPGETKAYKALMERVGRKNIMLAGTSAGASAMSEQMLHRTRRCVPGLAITPHHVIDTHANRISYDYTGATPEELPPRKATRIAEALSHPENRCTYGLSMEEGTGLIMTMGNPTDIEFFGAFGKEGKGVHILECGGKPAFLNTGNSHQMKPSSLIKAGGSTKPSKSR